ncbi:LuxR C-terminal-related transcriptional regulator [Streptomyces sp. NPDC050560]|uniref:helix-turn-helix transcriptional regulator n=1 Tax=Streptomyces sp. NPDC050560 TaxID=3365630 RepID=UPI0037A67F85
MREAFNWPITARDTELQHIRSALGRRGGALLVGAPGVGKSLLLSTALRQAADEGRTVLHVGGVGWSGDTRARGFGTLAECLDSIRPSTEDGTGGPPPLVGIDDAHLVDSPSSVQLHRLVTAGRLSVLAATRQDAPTPPGVDKLWVERLVEHIEVARFDSSAMGQVLRARLGGHTDTTTLERLWAATHGNALMLRELIEHALEDGTLECADGVWRWSGLTARPGKRLSDVIRVGLRDLSSEEHELVHMLAIMEPLELEIVAAAGLAKAAESLDLRGIVSVERTRARVRLRLAVPLSRVVVASRMSDLTAQRLRREIADALERTGARGDDDVLRIVSLRVEAGLTPDHTALLKAARIAIRRRDFTLAERMCLLALQEPPGTPEPPPLHVPMPDSAGYVTDVRRLLTRVDRRPDEAVDRVRAALLLGEVLVGQGHSVEAETVFSAALETRVRVPVDEYVAASHTRIVNMAWSLGRIDDARELLARTVARVEPEHADALHGTGAVIAVMSDRLDEAVTIGEAMLGERVAGRAVAQALVPTVAFARCELGDPAGALDLINRYEEALTDWDTDAIMLARSVSGRCSSLLGNLQDVAEELDVVHRQEPGHGRPVLLQALLDRCRLLRLLGRSEEAVGMLRRAVAAGTSHEYPVTSAWPLALLAGALAEAGDHAGALRTLVEVRSRRSEVPRSPVAEDEVAFESALVLAHTGDFYTAGAQAAELAERAGAAGRTVRAVAALQLAARVTEGEAISFRHHSLLRAAHTTGGLIRVYARHIEALSEGDGAALTDVSEQFVRMGALPFATEAAAQAARAFRAAGQHRKSREAAAACRDLQLRCGVPMPAWVERDARQEHASASLTPREREVAALASAGMSNRDIADRLVVSVRTVENHLHRIYHKLGITARNDLKRGMDKLSSRTQDNRMTPLRLVGAAGSEQVA